MFGGRDTFSLASHWQEPFFLENAFGGRATIFLTYKYFVSFYLKVSL